MNSTLSECDDSRIGSISAYYRRAYSAGHGPGPRGRKENGKESREAANHHVLKGKVKGTKNKHVTLRVITAENSFFFRRFSTQGEGGRKHEEGWTALASGEGQAVTPS